MNSPLRSCSKNRDGFGVLLERLRAEQSVDERAGEGGANAAAPDDANGAVRHWQAGARESRDDPWPRWMLAEALLDSGDPEGAWRAWRKALVISPDFAEPALRLAQAEFRNGNDLEAVRWLKRIAGRRKTDDGLRVAILGLCLLEGESRHARAFAEAFLVENPLSNRLATALFHVFRLFDDVPRARQASGLSAESRSRDPERLRLALRCAYWTGEGDRAVQLLSVLAEIAPGGQALARKAVAQHRAGDQEAAARTLAAAAQQFISLPGQLSDLAAALSWPSLDTLRQVVISTLRRLSAANDEAAAALALAAYRLGDWRTASEALADLQKVPDWPEMQIIESNLEVLARGRTPMPADAAAFAFRRNVDGLVPPTPQDIATGEGGPVMVIAGQAAGGGHLDMLLQVFRGQEEGVSVLEIEGLRQSAVASQDTACLAGLFHGISDFQVDTPAHLPPPDGEAPRSGLGYLPPQTLAEVLWVRDRVAQVAPSVVHVAGDEHAVPAALGALHAGIRRVWIHATPDWLESGPARQSWFDTGVARLLSDERCRLIASSEAVAETSVERFGLKKRPAVVLPGLDGRVVRNNAVGIHKLRALQSMTHAGETEPAELISVFGLDGLKDLEQVRTLAGELAVPGQCEFVVWGPPGSLGLASRLSDIDGVQVLRWPGNTGAFLIHCSLALAFSAASSLQLFSHAAAEVPVLLDEELELPISSRDGTEMPAFGRFDAATLKARLTESLADAAALDAAGLNARLWVQAHRDLRHVVRAMMALERRS